MSVTLICRLPLSVGNPYPSVEETITLDSLFALITFITGKIIDNMKNTNNRDLYAPEKWIKVALLVKSFV